MYIIICTSCFYNFNIDIFHIMLIRVKIKEIRIRIRITVGGNAFPQLQRKTSHLVLRTVLADFISLIAVISDVFPEGYSQLSS